MDTTTALRKCNMLENRQNHRIASGNIIVKLWYSIYAYVRAHNHITYKCHYWVQAPTNVSMTMHDDIALDVIYIMLNVRVTRLLL